ncbi:hypothetical protein EDB80DRAFT_815736 [Ilyonectria destructans]|nr:hypothetical protein EDB80DRAFT_815736 [Ilyonectria destructans]
MTSKAQTLFLGEEKDCSLSTDPRINKELAASLKDKNVVIAGAGRGIGRSSALFLTHASAKSLSLMALELDEVEETAGLCREINPKVLLKTAAFDVTDYGKSAAFVKEADKDFGGVHVLLMNAGRPPQWLPTAECDPRIWWDTVAVSLQGSFNFSRSVLPIMQRQKEGRIIFTSSAGAHSNFGMSSYTLGKLGMIRLCEVLHHENFKEYNIKCFAYNPGRIRTRFFTDFRDRVEGKSRENSYVASRAPNEDKSAQTAVNAFKDIEWDTPELPAGLVTTLASGRLDFMSGRYLDAARSVEEYEKERANIKDQDLHRVRLHVSSDLFIPQLDF